MNIFFEESKYLVRFKKSDMALGQEIGYVSHVDELLKKPYIYGRTAYWHPMNIF